MKYLVLGLMIIGASLTATAQVFTPLPIPSMSMPGLGVHIPSPNVDDKSGKKIPAPLPSAAADPKSLMYTPSATRTRANLANFATKTSATDPAGGKQMAAMFASTDVIGQFGKALVPYGLRVDDVSHAYTVWWMNAWQASKGINDDFDKATALAVAAQAGRGLLSSPKFLAASEAQKQELAESLLVQAALIGSAQSTYAKDPKMLQQLAASVKQGAKASGIDLETMELTPQGFKAAGK